MKVAFYILAFFFAALAVRMIEDGESIYPEIICVGFAILCFYCASIWDSVQDNNEVK